VHRRPVPGELGHLYALRHRALAICRSIAYLAGPAAEAAFTGRPIIDVVDGTTDHASAMDALSRDRRHTPATAIRGAEEIVGAR